MSSVNIVRPCYMSIIGDTFFSLELSEGNPCTALVAPHEHKSLYVLTAVSTFTSDNVTVTVCAIGRNLRPTAIVLVEFLTADNNRK